MQIVRISFAALAGIALACASKPTPVTVTGEAADRASVAGVLEAYRDPQCDCPVETTFAGRLNGDTIEGTFTTRGAQSAGPQTGTWRVKRSR